MKMSHNRMILGRVRSSLGPQDSAIANHLYLTGSLSRIEAEAMFKCRHLPGPIHRIREAGIQIDTEYRKDSTGQRYARYLVA